MTTGTATFDLRFDMEEENTVTERFQAVDESEKNRIFNRLHSDNTKKATKRSVKVF